MSHEEVNARPSAAFIAANVITSAHALPAGCPPVALGYMSIPSEGVSHHGSRRRGRRGRRRRGRKNKGRKGKDDDVEEPVEEDVQQEEEESVSGASGAGGGGGGGGAGARDVFPAGTYKTEMCRASMQLGVCEYGDACQFAHSLAELRPRKFDAKYKTVLCENYHSDGSCRFGARCKFIHDEVRVRVDDHEYWLVLPTENLVRVEVVTSSARKELLQALADNPPPMPANACPDVEARKASVVAAAREAAAKAAATRAVFAEKEPGAVADAHDNKSGQYQVPSFIHFHNDQRDNADLAKLEQEVYSQQATSPKGKYFGHNHSLHGGDGHVPRRKRGRRGSRRARGSRGSATRDRQAQVYDQELAAQHEALQQQQQQQQQQQYAMEYAAAHALEYAGFQQQAQQQQYVAYPYGYYYPMPAGYWVNE